MPYSQNCKGRTKLALLLGGSLLTGTAAGIGFHELLPQTMQEDSSAIWCSLGVGALTALACFCLPLQLFYRTTPQRRAYSTDSPSHLTSPLNPSPEIVIGSSIISPSSSMPRDEDSPISPYTI